MKVIGVGFGRTGTSSLGTALERLGFGPCYHMFDIVEQPYRIQHWIDAAGRGTADWDRILDGYATVMDFPAVAFWRELVEHYPDAKVVLTVRDPQRWYDSASRTIFRKAIQAEDGPAVARAAFRLITKLSPDFGRFTRMIELTVQQRLFGSSVANRGHAIDVFRKHSADVRREVAADRLLVFDVSEGWLPLCDFLGVPAPIGEPFPHGNDVAAFNREEGARMRRLMLRSMLRVVHNAVAISHVPFAELALDEWRRVIDTNLTGAYLVAHASLPLLGDGASIVFVGSKVAMVGVPLRAHYTASKAGLIGLARSMAKELGPRGTRVNVVAPGVIEGEATAKLPPERFQYYQNMTSLKRLGRPTEIAEVVLFLASPAAAYLTGETINVDGGA